MEKRIYSLNLICYLRMNEIEHIDVGFDRKSRNVFYVYEDNDELKDGIEGYKDVDAMVKLHGFIGEFKKLKDEIFRYKREFDR